MLKQIDVVNIIIFLVVLYLLHKFLNWYTPGGDKNNDDGGGLVLKTTQNILVVNDTNGDLDVYNPMTDAFTTNSLSVSEPNSTLNSTVNFISNSTGTTFNKPVTVNALINTNGAINVGTGTSTRDLSVTGATDTTDTTDTTKITGLLTANGGITSTAITATSVNLTNNISADNFKVKEDLIIEGLVISNTNTLNIVPKTGGTLNLGPTDGSKTLTKLGGNTITIGGDETTLFTFQDSTGVATLTLGQIISLQAALTNKTFIADSSHLDIFSNGEIKHDNSNGYAGYLRDVTGVNGGMEDYYQIQYR